MGKRGKLSANKSNSSNGGASKKIKTNGQGNSQNGSSSHANTSKRSQARSNPKPDAIDDDLWPAEEAFHGSELENLELVRTVMMKQMKRIEQELFREDHNNQLAGIKTQVESPSKGPGKEQTDDGNRNKAQPSSDGASSSSKTPDSKTADQKNDAKGGTSKSSSTSKETKKEDDDMYDEWKPPPLSIPLCTDVRHLPVLRLKDQMLKTRGQLFDVIMMDPPWQLATANPTRGVAIGYQQLADFHIKELPVRELQTDGFIFIWVINAKFRFALSLLEYWGYELVDEIVWIKQTVNRRMAKSHGFYLQHAKETCLVGRKGKHPKNMVGGIASDVIYSIRRGQSQKPEEIYKYIEQLVPNGHYLEIFGRRNNLHDYWVTVGNEL